MKSNVVICGDCLDELPKIESGSVAMILCDPPYQTTNCDWDKIVPLEPMWKELKRIIKPNGAIVMTASQPFTSVMVMSNLKMFRYCWYWEKEKPTNPMQCKRRAGKTVEECVVFYSTQPTYNPIKYIHIGELVKNSPKGNLGELVAKGSKTKVTPYNDDGTRYPTSVIKFNKDLNPQHPTQKPVALMEYLILTYTNPGELVLDFTFGSGTTLVAAQNLGRKFIGIEKSPKYVAIAKERLSQQMLEFK